jgi:hypothetical protein
MPMYHTPGLKQILAYANMLIHQKPETCHFLNNFVFSNQSIVLQYEYFFEEHQTGLSD